MPHITKQPWHSHDTRMATPHNAATTHGIARDHMTDMHDVHAPTNARAWLAAADRGNGYGNHTGCIMVWPTRAVTLPMRG